MDAPRMTDWMSAIGTLIAALVAAPAAVYAAIHTRRAADASAKAAEEAANQVRELQILREPRAVLKIRVPDQFIEETYVKYGKGNYQYRSGPPVYVDVWNVSGPTIMVMDVIVVVDGAPPNDEEEAIKPQLLVESGKVLPISIGHRLLRLVAIRESQAGINFPDKTKAEAQFTVGYYSVDGERSVKVGCKFQFRVTEEHLIAWIE